MQKSTSSLIWAVFTAVMISVLVVFAMFSFSACRILKRHTKTEIIKDSSVVRNDTASLVKINSISTRTRVEKDSAIGIPGNWLRFILIDGGNNPVDTTMRKGSLELKQYRNKAGHLVTECRNDSLTMVIRRLIQDSIIVQNRYDSIARQLSSSYHKNEYKKTEKDVKVLDARLVMALVILVLFAILAFKVLK